MDSPARRSLPRPCNQPGRLSEPTETWVTDTRTARFAPGSLAAAAAGLDAERDRLAYLARVTETMIGTLDTGESATRLAELAVARLCDWAIVALGPEDGRARGGGPRAPGSGPPAGTWTPTATAGCRVTRQDTPIAIALRTGRPVQLAPIEAERVEPTLPTEEVREAWRRLDTTSAVVVPLRARGRDVRRPGPAEQRRPAAALRPGDHHGRGGGPAGRTGTGQRPPLRAAAGGRRDAAAQPPESADARRLPAARDRGALPAGRAVPGGRWRLVRRICQPDGATALVIGDVVGHDVEATAAMSQIRSMLRALAYDRPESPAHVLARVDRVLTGLRVGHDGDGAARPGRAAAVGRPGRAVHRPLVLGRPPGSARARRRRRRPRARQPAAAAARHRLDGYAPQRRTAGWPRGTPCS